jgi:N-formylmaleamate deformylase
MKVWQEGYVSVNEVNLHYHRTGHDKPTIVLAHGIADNGLCWTRLARALEDRYDLVLYDARGHGFSDQPGNYSPESHVADATGLITALRLNQPILLGHSMGGANLPFVAARHPDMVRALILEDPHWPEPQHEGSYDVAAWRSAIASLKTQSFEELLTLGKQANPTWDDIELQPWAQAKQQVDPDVVAWLSPRHDLNGWRETVKQLHCPTLVITGDTEVTVTPPVAEEARRLCPTLEVTRINHAGHRIRRDQFSAYLGAVEIFLNKLPRVM